MKPIKFSDYRAKTLAMMQNPTVIDLLDYGLAKSAPCEDGHPILTLRVDFKSGTLLPAAA